MIELAGCTGEIDSLVEFLACDGSAELDRGVTGNHQKAG